MLSDSSLSAGRRSDSIDRYPEQGEVRIPCETGMPDKYDAGKRSFNPKKDYYVALVGGEAAQEDTGGSPDGILR